MTTIDPLPLPCDLRLERGHTTYAKIAKDTACPPEGLLAFIYATR